MLYITKQSFVFSIRKTNVIILPVVFSLLVSIEVDRYNELFLRKESNIFLSFVTTFVCLDFSRL